MVIRSLYWKKILAQFSPSIGERLRTHRETQWKTPDEIRDLQNSKLRMLLHHAAESVPYYRERFREIGFSPSDFRGIENLRGLPLLTKGDIQANGNRLIREGSDIGTLLKNHTGGSTGEPLTFYQDPGYLGAMHADLWRNLEWCGYRFGDPQCYLWGSDVDAKRYRGTRGWLRGWLQNILWVDVFDLSEERLEAVLPRIERFCPRLLVGYASSLVLLARLAGQRGFRMKGLVGIQSSAEVLTSSFRTEIEETFGVRIFDRYGCREVGNIAHECEAHDGLHVNAENNLVEFVDGRIVVTNLNNYAMPFIRYVIGDSGEPGSGEACVCGRGLPRMRVVTGRLSDIIRTPGGRILHGEFFTHLFYGAKGVKRFQVVQENRTTLTIRIVKGPDFDSQLPERIETLIRESGDPGFKVLFEYPDAIDPLRSGKFQFVVSRVSMLEESPKTY